MLLAAWLLRRRYLERFATDGLGCAFNQARASNAQCQSCLAGFFIDGFARAPIGQRV